MATITKQIELTTVDCAACGTTFAFPDSLLKNFRKSHETFYCPTGHRNHYPQDNEEEKLRKELKRKEQELADKAIETYRMQSELETQIKKQKKDLKRLTNGVCPCCNRTFANLHNHMKKQHPEAVLK